MKKDRKKADPAVSKGDDPIDWSERVLQKPFLNVFATSLECFEVQNTRLAIGGKGFDLKIYDLGAREGKNACIFTAQPPPLNQLGLRAPVWISGLVWLTPNNSDLVAACWRTEPVVRIYNVNSDGKSEMSLDLKDKSAVHPNPPAFTCISTTNRELVSVERKLSPNNKKEQLLIGSTVGRLICVDIRLEPHTYQTAGAFKGFGGSVRDVIFVSDGQSNSIKNGHVISCCLDRFVRIHEMKDTGFEKSKTLRGKFYLKTRPTCLQPLFDCELINEEEGEEKTEAHADDD